MGDARLILEESGRFYFFSDYHYGWGDWKETDPYTVALSFKRTDPVEVYVYGREAEQEQVIFGGFGDKQAFVSMGKKGRGAYIFSPVFRKEPECPYETTQSIVLPRNDLNEITVAVNAAPQATGKKSDPVDGYTYTLPARYGKVSVIINSDAFLEQRNHNILWKDKKYTIGDLVLEKQEIDLHTLPEVLNKERALLQKARIARFRKTYYVKEEAVELLEPVTFRQVISVRGEPLFTIDCPENDPFPPVVAPTPLKSR